MSCNSDFEYSELSFIGDSLVARWDLEASFPTSLAYNYGLSGSGVAYLQSQAGKFGGRKVVVISGTNDVNRYRFATEEALDDYVDAYLAAIDALGAERVYLYSVFPRGRQFDGEFLNPIILKLNAKVKEKLLQYTTDMRYLEVYSLLVYDGLLNPQYSLDGLHLNVYGYSVITNALLLE